MSSATAKISRPRPDGIAPRERLFHLLDRGRTRPVIWIAAVAGAGKTALLASYTETRNIPCLWYQLDPTDGDPVSFFDCLGQAAQFACSRNISLPSLLPEHFPAIAVFARRFFAILADCMPQSSMIVFDDYHDLPAESPIHEILRHGLAVFPQSLNTFILSRKDPPPLLTRMFFNGAMVRVTGEGLRLTLEESFSLAAMRGLDSEADADRIQDLHQLTEGWAAGFVLSMIHAGETGSAPVLSQEALVNYFAGEIIDRLDPSIRDFLEKTALFPEFTIDMARKLTGHSETRRILSAMIRNNHFTTMHGDDRPVYRYHALFRNCLLARTQMTLEENDLQALRRAAAIILQEEGAFNDAFSIFADAELWEEAAHLVRIHAGSLANNSLFSTLTDWIGRFPPRYLETDPWLLFWLGSALLPLQGPTAARMWFEKAYGKFAPEDDAAGIYLSWCGVVECYLSEWHLLKPLDVWLNDFKEIRARYPVYPHPDIEGRVVTAIFSALCFRRPWSKEVVKWTREAERLLSNSPNMTIRLLLVRQLIYWLGWKGDFKKIESLMEEFGDKAQNIGLRASFLEKVHFRSLLAFANWMTGKLQEAATIVNETIADVEKEGMPALYHLLLSTGVFLHFDHGQIEEGRKHLDRMEKLLSDHVLEIGNYHYMKALEMAHRGCHPAALRHVDISLRTTFRAGAPLQATFTLLAKAHILLAMKEYRKSARLLRRAYKLARWIGSSWLLARYELTAAELCFASGDGEGMKHLQQGFIICRENRIMHFEWWLPPHMARLCARAMEAGIETEFVLEMVRTNNLATKAQPLECEEWPWPVRIHSLGRFEVVIDGGKPVSSGKVQKKPLELLKALISLGGQEVPESKLADCLWPDAEGDLGRNSFNVTLVRLRRLLGHDQALVFQGGRLSLNRNYCWVDGFALERLMEEGEQVWKRIEGGRGGLDDISRAVRLTEKVLSLYQGHFLPGDADLPWTVSTRERLRGKFIRGVESLGTHWEKIGEPEKAMDCYLNGLERDALVEEFYQRLMLCYRHLGRLSKGLGIYRRCRLTLAAGLGLKPSAETEAIHLTLLG
jgi:LuxR family transcriptional regulator, maltose regulon positive regulatory protein